MNLTEKQLQKTIKKCIKNDRKSQELLFKTYYSKMMAVCMRYSRDHDTAQDVCQTGFIKIFEKLERYSFGGSFEGWMRRIMVNTAIDHIRKSKKELTIIEDESRIEDDLLEDEDIELSEMLGIGVADVVEAMQSLSPAYKTVFNLYVMEDMSHKEVAEILGISEGTSKSNLAKAKKNLKVILKKKMKENEEP
ncbi:MAG TPA: RNA polymerase subunit sigma-70 [Flavobacteriales bacterium]|nr:RNA polymerase subunit sigma-70 [Flavobacteriales bacterium]|tara:strand:- start:1446 stop:2021 length:576 start_codon:yes stop_codon:yes gene_type:complete